ncbi:MAG TPA: TRAP transporter small permease [Burkholderiales bacterium]|jgi:TRAP-type C4-dicarboxylate transport system permease small subunit|nr:TRAP transporter small permease [Burkholderiales bacterium]
MRKAAAAVSVALIAAVFTAVLLGVARRYLFGAPLTWSDELTAILFVWCVFWTAAFAVSEREHVAFDLVYETLPPPVARVLAIVAYALVGVALLAVLPKTVDFVRFLWRERTPALQWRLDLVYACFPVFIAASALRFLWQAARLCRRPS